MTLPGMADLQLLQIEPKPRDRLCLIPGSENTIFLKLFNPAAPHCYQ